MAKRISEKQKKEIIDDFFNKKTIEEISKKFNYTKLTISRNLKKSLGEKKYYELINISKMEKEMHDNQQFSDQYLLNNKDSYQSINQETSSENPFLEIAPLNLEIDAHPQKDLSSVSINEVDLPKVVYMIVDKQIELKPKLLKEYVEWNFLSEKDLKRKTIEIYFELKIAKRSCYQDQKVIKVPNSDVLKIAAPILLSRGISRIVSSEQLISL